MHKHNSQINKDYISSRAKQDMVGWIDPTQPTAQAATFSSSVSLVAPLDNPAKFNTLAET